MSSALEQESHARRTDVVGQTLLSFNVVSVNSVRKFKLARGAVWGLGANGTSAPRAPQAFLLVPGVGVGLSLFHTSKFFILIIVFFNY